MSRTRFPLIAAVAVVVAAVVAVVVATSGASTKNTAQSVAAASAISVKRTSLGPTLVDANAASSRCSMDRSSRIAQRSAMRPATSR